MSTRNHKDIKQMTGDNQQTMSNVLPPLVNLRAIPEEDKTEAAMLRSRIDEQSKLIMILKQRADEVTAKQNTLERVNSELLEFREQATEKLEYELRRHNMLDQRFHDLASNHQEIIKYKDEYKRVNKELRAENSRLKEENAALFSKALIDKDTEIKGLQNELIALKDNHLRLEARLQSQRQESREKEEGYKTQLTELQTSYKAQVKQLQSNVNELEERLKAARYKIQCLTDSQKSASTESENKLLMLTKERDELLELTMQRGKLIHKEQNENKKLLKKIEEKDLAVKRMEEKFERESASVNANLQVRKLQEDVRQSTNKHTELIKEFEAYKKHSQGMLQKERELNERLRHLTG